MQEVGSRQERGLKRQRLVLPFRWGIAAGFQLGNCAALVSVLSSADGAGAARLYPRQRPFCRCLWSRRSVEPCTVPSLPGVQLLFPEPALTNSQPGGHLVAAVVTFPGVTLAPCQQDIIFGYYYGIPHRLVAKVCYSRQIIPPLRRTKPVHYTGVNTSCAGTESSCRSVLDSFPYANC